MRKVALEIAQECNRLFVEGDQTESVGVKPFQLQQAAAQHPRLGRE